MKLHSILKRVSIVCYSLIFVQGMMIAMPLILVLTIGLVDASGASRLFLLLADSALILLTILHFKKKTKMRIVLECIIYLMLFSPLVWMLTNFPLQTFAFSLFIVPFAGFVILYPLSLLLSCLEYRHR